MSRFVNIVCGLLYLFTFLISIKGFAADSAAGKAKFQQLCATCHGASGKGDGVAAMGLNPKPRTFDAAFLKGRTDAQLEKVIKDGGTAVGLSPLMPPWGSQLTPTDIQNIIAFIRSLAGGK